MSDSSLKLKVFQLAQRRGLDPGNLTPAQFTSLAIRVKAAEDPAGLLADVGHAGASLVRTKLLGRVVSEDRVRLNEFVCEHCPDGSYRERNGRRVCEECACGNQLLESKQRDPTWGCPRGNWDNRWSLETLRAVLTQLSVAGRIPTPPPLPGPLPSPSAGGGTQDAPSPIPSPQSPPVPSLPLRRSSPSPGSPPAPERGRGDSGRSGVTDSSGETGGAR